MIFKLKKLNNNFLLEYKSKINKKYGIKFYVYEKHLFYTYFLYCHQSESIKSVTEIIWINVAYF